MEKGKQQILFNYLPGRTFDFERITTIAKVTNIRGVPLTELNLRILLSKIRDEAKSWNPDYRPVLRDDVLKNPNKFILIDPKLVESEIFPKVLWCDNNSCGYVVDYTSNSNFPPYLCPKCNKGKLNQLRFIKIHRCGNLQPLKPPVCANCHSSKNMSLHTRGSERIKNFRWKCLKCNIMYELIPGYCNVCKWPANDANLKRMSILVHRSSKTYYAHTALLLNIPTRSMDAFFNRIDWPYLVAAKYLNFPEFSGKTLLEISSTLSNQSNSSSTTMSALDVKEMDELFKKQSKGEISAEELISRMHTLRNRASNNLSSLSQDISEIIIERTSIPLNVWEHAGQEILESVVPFEISASRDLFNENNDIATTNLVSHMGIERFSLISDFPMLTATYAFSRDDHRPNQCILNPFPQSREYDNRYPIFVDQIRADAIIIRLNPTRIVRWLEKNGFKADLPSGSVLPLSELSYFVNLFDSINLKETVLNSNPHVRMVFCLLHTISHLFVKKAALQCGLDTTSLSEYIMPKTLSFAIYCNHRFGATIGALTSLYEQSVVEWLNTIYQDTNKCIYDPVCYDRESSCHACTHLPETSCRFFNLNLSRAMLFGGPDPHIGNISIGFFDNSLNS